MMLLWLCAYIFSGLLLSMPFSCIFTVLLDLMGHSQHNVCAAVDARGARVICNAGGVQEPLDMAGIDGCGWVGAYLYIDMRYVSLLRSMVLFDDVIGCN